jgi:hypothetical protein
MRKLPKRKPKSKIIRHGFRLGHFCIRDAQLGIYVDIRNIIIFGHNRHFLPDRKMNE